MMNRLIRHARTLAILLTSYAAMSAAQTSDTTRAAIAPPADTLARIVPFNNLGALSVTSDPYTSIDAAGIMWKDYRTLTDLLSPTPGVFVSERSSPGQNESVSFTGAGQTATGFLVDGVTHNDPITRTYLFALFPVESIERLEIVTGVRAFLYSDNASGGAVNIVTKSFANNKPYTHIRYSQAGDGYVQTDALFSQNVVSRFNLMFGLSYLGYGFDNLRDFYRGRYANAANQAYTFRTKLRYNISSRLNLVLTHFFHQTQTGLNGGIDLSQPGDIYNENAASVVNLESYEKRYDHHLALTAAYRPTGDSTLTASLTLFGAHQLQEYRDEENRFGLNNGILIREDFGSGRLGARAQADWAWGGNAFTAIAEAKRTAFQSSMFGPAETESRRFVSIKDELSPFRFVKFAAFVRIENGQKQMLENFGADASIRISDILTATAGASQSHRRPTRTESYLASGKADSTVAKVLEGSRLAWALQYGALSDEIHHVAEAALRFSPYEEFRLDLRATRRRIGDWIDNSLIVPQRGQDVTFDVVTASVRTNFGPVHVDASAEYTHQSDVFRGRVSTTHDAPGYPSSYKVLLFPEWRGQASIYFRGELVKGNLDLKAGVSGRFWSAFDGMQERFPDGVQNPTFKRTIGNAGVLDLFVIAHIGDAQIHVIWENVTNSGYMLSPFYPMYDRGFRFGVSWEFWN